MLFVHLLGSPLARTLAYISFKNTLASGSRDQTIRIWNLNDYTCTRILKGHTGSVLCVQLLDKNTLASGSYDLIISF